MYRGREKLCKPVDTHRNQVMHLLLCLSTDSVRVYLDKNLFRIQFQTSSRLQQFLDFRAVVSSLTVITLACFPWVWHSPQETPEFKTKGRFTKKTDVAVFSPVFCRD